MLYSYSLLKFPEVHNKVILCSYSYASLDDVLNLPHHISIGLYTSIGCGFRVFTANHPVSYLSTHPFFIERILGL